MRSVSCILVECAAPKLCMPCCRSSRDETYEGNYHVAVRRPHPQKEHGANNRKARGSWAALPATGPSGLERPLGKGAFVFCFSQGPRWVFESREKKKKLKQPLTPCKQATFFFF